MIRDVFYYGAKPNAHPREKFAESLDDARDKSTTEHFWIINEFCDYRNFDWDFDFYDLSSEDIWAEHHNNVWPSTYHKDSGTWLCPKAFSELIIHRADVTPLVRKKFDIPRYFIETTLENLVNEHPHEIFWALNKDIDYTNFNFNWEPHHSQIRYVQVFGSAESLATQTYYINSTLWMQGYQAMHYVTQDSLDSKSLYNLFSKPNIFFIDKGNPQSTDRFNKLQEKFGDRIQKTRYLNSWIDTIARCVNKSSTKMCWILDSDLDYSNFDFEYYPNPWQTEMIHVFGTQWNHWGTTFMVNRDTFINDTKNIKVIEHAPNINFVKHSRAKAIDCLYDVFLIDHGNSEMTDVHTLLKEKTQKNIVVVPYFKNYLDTFKNILKMLSDRKEHFIWITSSICDYDLFDFTYVCDPFAKEQLHVFYSNKQKYGDTFLVNVSKLRSSIDSIENLSEYNSINFNEHISTPRLLPPVIVSGETHVKSFNNDFDFPYAIFKTHDNVDIKVIDNEPMSLWQNNHKIIKIYTTGATQLVAPKEVKQYLKNELYDYPYISKPHLPKKSISMDVVFVSNNETDCDKRYKALERALGKPPKWVNGVNGRENALRKAAELSETDWVFIVPGKVEINKHFDFDWQPDRMQAPKHYIFYVTNPVNKLCYGHMAPVMYNKNLVLETVDYGLDFTMSKKHEIVKINSGIAHYNLDPLMTWRTAFREAVKLKAANDIESLDRLNTWLTVAEGLNSEYSIKGAEHGVEYYYEVSGDAGKLQLSFDWSWLKTRFDSKFSS